MFLIDYMCVNRLCEMIIHACRVRVQFGFQRFQDEKINIV